MTTDGPDNPQKFLFIGGLHRSGTTLLHQCITDHPALNRFRTTNVPEDEGQFLQTVYPDDYAYGGPGQIGFFPAAHLTETSPLATPAHAAQIAREWSGYWEKDAALHTEKTPRNLLQSRFLNALFPQSRFVFLVRHPIAVAMATRKWALAPLSNLVLHWLACHETLLADIEHLNDFKIFRYEDFIRKPQAVVDQVYDLVNVPTVPLKRRVRADGNRDYEAEWQELQRWARLKRYSFAERYTAGSRSDWRLRGVLRRLNGLSDRWGWGRHGQAYIPYHEAAVVEGHLRPQLQRFGYDIEDGRFVTLPDAVLPYVQVDDAAGGAART
ncbi:MAG: sulfotransferase [Geminicoccaceae bacterium]|nr:MAG: sulfotransferase [Geminicoccaceae bacterium]